MRTKRLGEYGLVVGGGSWVAAGLAAQVPAKGHTRHLRLRRPCLPLLQSQPAAACLRPLPAPPAGGGFGGKESRSAFLNVAAAVPAYHLRKPVRQAPPPARLRRNVRTSLAFVPARNTLHCPWLGRQRNAGSALLRHLPPAQLLVPCRPSLPFPQLLPVPSLPSSPCRLVLDRDEDMQITGTRHPFMGRYKVGPSLLLFSLLRQSFSTGSAARLRWLVGVVCGAPDTSAPTPLRSGWGAPSGARHLGYPPNVLFRCLSSRRPAGGLHQGGEAAGHRHAAVLQRGILVGHQVGPGWGVGWGGLCVCVCV